MFGTLGGPELFLIFVVALIVFGPRKLPEIGKSVGKMMAEFRRASNEFKSTIESEVEAEKIRESMRIEPPKYDAGKPVEPAAATSETASGYPGGTDPEPTATSEAASDDAMASGAPDAPAGSQPATPADGVPDTVSRKAADDPTPIEPK